MQLIIEQAMEQNTIIYPQFELQCSFTGIFMDVKKTRYILKALQHKGYVHRYNDRMPRFLTVEETIKYYAQLSEHTYSTDFLCQIFKLQHAKKMRLKKLSESEKVLLSFLKPFLFSTQLAIIEQPFERLEIEQKKIVLYLFELMIERGCNILLLSDNFEHLHLATKDIYRIDDVGLHKIETEDNTEIPEDSPVPIIKIEKIHARHQDKTLLFNPPEIDYIESIDGQAFLHIAGQRFFCPYTLTELEKKLFPYGFYRCHRSYIVNLQKVREMVTWTKNSYSLKLHVAGDVIVPLSRTKLTELKTLLNVH